MSKLSLPLLVLGSVHAFSCFLFSFPPTTLSIFTHLYLLIKLKASSSHMIYCLLFCNDILDTWSYVTFNDRNVWRVEVSSGDCGAGLVVVIICKLTGRILMKTFL